MSFLNTVVADFRKRKLWPVALLLLAALIAVPVLLSKSPAPVPAPSLGHPAPVAGSAVPVLSVSTSGSAVVGGTARDPFAQQPAVRAANPAAAAVARAATAVAAHAVTSVVNAASGGASASARRGPTPASPLAPVTSSPSVGTGSLPAVPLPTPPAVSSPSTKPRPTTLGPRQAYHVSLSLTDDSGGVISLDPVQRLSILPNASQPLVVELGVLQGGRKVAFAAMPGTQASGDGNCTPAPDNCQIFTLAVDQVESLSVGSDPSSAVASELSVADITIDRLASAAAGAKARNDFSAAGEKLLQAANLDALSLFDYHPRLGVLFDLNNLQVGQ